MPTPDNQYGEEDHCRQSTISAKERWKRTVCCLRNCLEFTSNMAQPSPQIDTEAQSIPTVDILPFFSQEPTTLNTQRLTSAKLLVEALHSFGFAKVTGHGLGNHEISDALGWVQKLFDLPYAEEMKAPHHPGPMPHRGYAGTERRRFTPRRTLRLMPEMARPMLAKICARYLTSRYPSPVVHPGLRTGIKQALGKLRDRKRE